MCYEKPESIGLQSTEPKREDPERMLLSKVGTGKDLWSKSGT